ncbi:MAG: D-glycero-D-manno-heptose 7-phosphate kinase [Thaumarchaeota archaeon]|nr:D-glycero-D-manno-heptose 7-phosphate kinase [Nitrososphaerota archaeon]
MILGMSPVRISFAGGGTDIPEYYEEFGGNVVVSSISRFIYVIMTPRNDNSFHAFSSDLETHHKPTNYDVLEPQHGTEIAVSVIKHLGYKEGANILICSDVPPGSGLGASGALAVNLVKTISMLNGDDWDKEKIAETAYHVGRHILNWPIGKQDEYATAFGGFNFIKFTKEKVTVSPICLNSSSIKELQQNLLLFFVGNTRNSATILSSQIERTKQRQQEVIESLHFVKNLAVEMYESLKKSDIATFGELLHKGWLAKKRFAKSVSNENIDKIYESALKQGALGGKLTGAGGGGHMLLYCEHSKQSSLIEKMESLGLKHVKFNFNLEGQKVLNLYDFTK